MAGGQERILRTRIRSVESTKKITRAMELIAASRMSRAQARIAGARPYLRGHGASARRCRLRRHGSGPPARRPRVTRAHRRRTIVSDRGLCGGYNAFVLRASERLMNTGESAGRDYTVTSAGKKAIGYFRFRGRAVAHPFSMPDAPTYEHARELAGTVVPGFMAGAIDLVQLVSTRFVSAGIQTVETRQILPLPPLGAEAGSGHPRPGPNPPVVAVAGGAEPATAHTPEEEAASGGSRAGSSSSSRPRRSFSASSCRVMPKPRAYRSPAGGVGVGADRPPAGHGGCHRQRRRSHQDTSGGS